MTMLIVLLTVGGVGLARSKSSDEEVDEPLVWADVQRQFERADRKTSGSADQPQATQPAEEHIPKGDAPNN